MWQWKERKTDRQTERETAKESERARERETERESESSELTRQGSVKLKVYGLHKNAAKTVFFLSLPTLQVRSA